MITNVALYIKHCWVPKKLFEQESSRRVFKYLPTDLEKFRKP